MFNRSNEMKKLLLSILLLSSFSYAGIGAWDTTGLILSVSPAALKNYENPAAFTSGTFPIYYGKNVSGTPLCTLTNMSSGYGYQTNGMIKFDRVDDYVKFNGAYIPTQTNTTKLTFEFYINFFRDANVYTLASIGDVSGNAASNMYLKISAGRPWVVVNRYGVGNCQATCSTADTLTTGRYHIVMVKNNDSLHWYINGNRPGSYSSYSLYTMGTTSFSTYGAFGVANGSTANTQYFKNGIYWANIYNVAWSASQVSARYAAIDSTMQGLGLWNKNDGTGRIGRIITIDSINTDASRPVGDTIKIYDASAAFNSTQGAGRVEIDSATTWKTCTVTSWDTALVKVIVPQVDAGSHSVRIFNLDSLGDTASVTISTSGPTISQQPTNQTAAFGATAQFSITVSGAAPIVHHWQARRATASWASVGTNSSTYTTPATVRADTNSWYRDSVSDANGYTMSDSAKLTVTLSPPVISYAASPVVCSTGVAYSFSPTNSGTAATTWSLSSGTLPTGFSFNTGSGVFSGTASATKAQTDYTVIASNVQGEDTTTMRITMNQGRPNVAYASNPARYSPNVAIATNSLSNAAGGSLTSVTTDPDMPAGLSLNGTTGAITGTPTTKATTTHTIIATNAIGADTVVLTIIVGLSQQGGISAFRQDAYRLTAYRQAAYRSKAFK